MGAHPLNLAVRFLLEVAALGAVGSFGWAITDGPLRWAATLGFPILFAAAWGTFAVPEDPSRSGNAPVPIPGIARLLLELGLFSAATTSLFAVGASSLAVGFGVAVILHYALSYDRIAWLIRH
jgi:hypothetical protein